MTQITHAPDERIAWPPGHAPASAVVHAKNVGEIARRRKPFGLIDCQGWPMWYKHCSNEWLRALKIRAEAAADRETNR